ncbi:MAG: SemiSWEET family sugar transporter [Parvibaculales bacterium]
MTTITLIGYFAGICTTFCLLPQVIKSWRNKKVDDLSLLYIFMLTLGVFAWSVYGLLTGDMPLFLSNSILVLLTGSLLWLKLKSLSGKN